MKCDCVSKVNDALRKDGMALDTAFGLDGKLHPHIAVRRSGDTKRRRGRLPLLTCSFCPFCGEATS